MRTLRRAPVRFLIVGVLAVACTAGSPSAEPPAPDVRTFDRDLEQYQRLLQVPGLAVGVAHGDSLIHFRGIGHADIERRTPITPETIFWIASVTKSFTAVALKQLEERGRISLDDELARVPNRYFDAARIEPGVTIAHVVGHTSESRPPGTLFVYNGGRYNLVFNVFDAVMPDEADADVVRPFTRAIEDGIVTPLALEHTVTRIASERFERLRPFVATPYAFDEARRGHVPDTAPLRLGTSYPATGMLSSVADLARFSHALSTGRLISRESYGELTTPSYVRPGGPSPYGMGWFTTTFEGVTLHWAFGYGDADAALLVRVPERDLALVMLSNAATPSGTTLLGYGNPLSSPVVAAFLKSFVLHDRLPAATIDYAGDVAAVEERLAELRGASGSTLYLEEALTYAMLLKLLPAGPDDAGARAAGLLEMLDRRFPGFLDQRRVEMFDLLARFDEPDVLRIGARLAASYDSSGTYHPIKAFHSGRIHERLGDAARAERFYRAVADRAVDGAAFVEQPVVHAALLTLAERLVRTDPEGARRYLESLVRYKERLGARDEEYRSARELLAAVEAP